MIPTFTRFCCSRILWFPLFTLSGYSCSVLGSSSQCLWKSKSCGFCLCFLDLRLVSGSATLRPTRQHLFGLLDDLSCNFLSHYDIRNMTEQAVESDTSAVNASICSSSRSTVDRSLPQPYSTPLPYQDSIDSPGTTLIKRLQCVSLPHPSSPWHWPLHGTSCSVYKQRPVFMPYYRYVASMPLDTFQSDTHSDSTLSPANTTSSTPTVLSTLSISPRSVLRHPTIHSRADNQYGPIVAFAVIGGLIALVIIYSVTHALYEQYHRRARQHAANESNEPAVDFNQLARELHRDPIGATLWDECRTRERTERSPVNRISESNRPPPPPYGAGECVPSYDDSERRYNGRPLGYVPVVEANANMLTSGSRGGGSPELPHSGTTEGYVTHTHAVPS